jgi:hypothetical protein
MELVVGIIGRSAAKPSKFRRSELTGVGGARGMGGRWCGKGVRGSVSRVVEIEEEIAGAVADVVEDEVPAMGMGREGAQGSDTKLYYESWMMFALQRERLHTSDTQHGIRSFRHYQH